MSSPIERSQIINGYHIPTARSLLGAVDLLPNEERGCLDGICTLINNLWITIKRIFHVIFSSDHLWNNNQTAREIIIYYINHPRENPNAREQIIELCNDLRYRALNVGFCGNDGTSYADGLIECLQQEQTIRPPPQAQQRSVSSSNAGSTLRSNPTIPLIRTPDFAPFLQAVDTSVNSRPPDYVPRTAPSNRQESPLIPLVQTSASSQQSRTAPLRASTSRPSVPEASANRKNHSELPGNSEENIRRNFPAHTTGNITLLERCKQLREAGLTWEEIRTFLPDLEADLKKFTAPIMGCEALMPEEQKKAYKTLCGLWAPRQYDASQEPSAPSINSVPNEDYAAAKDPYDLFGAAFLDAVQDLAISSTEMQSAGFINSDRMMKACLLTILKLLQQAKLDAVDCMGHSVKFNDHLLARYAPPIVVYIPDATNEMKEKIYYDRDILSSTEVGCDPVGAKRLLQIAEDHNRLEELTSYLIHGAPSPEELDREHGADPTPGLQSSLLKELLQTMASQIKDRYGKKIAAATAKRLQAIPEPVARPADSADFKTYTEEAQTPYKLIQKALKWSVQHYVNEGLVTLDDLEAGVGYGYAKGVIGKLAVFNLIKNAVPVHGFCIRLTSNVDVECGRFYAFEPEPINPLLLVSHERYITNEFCGSGQVDDQVADPSTDLIKAKNLMEKLTEKELNFAEDYLYASQLQELYALRQIEDERVKNLEQKANAELNEMSEERRLLIKSFIKEIVGIHSYITSAYYDEMIREMIEEADNGAPEAIKFLDNPPVTVRPLRSTIPVEIPLVKQDVKTQYLPAHIISKISIKNRPKRTTPPTYLLDKIGTNAYQALTRQNTIISNNASCGSCMFGALALEIFEGIPTDRAGLNVYANHLRIAAADYMLANPDQFLPYMATASDSSTTTARHESESVFMQRMRATLLARLQEHCDTMKDTVSLEYGTGMELDAISCIFGVPIHVFCYRKPLTLGTEGIEQGVIQPNCKVGDGFDGAPIRLIYSGIHYEPLRLK